MTHPTNSQFQDYRNKPRSKRPPAMRIMEKLLGEPMEQLCKAAWHHHRNIPDMARVFSLEPSTLKRWMRRLGLYVCVGCSHETGKLKSHATQCLDCRRWFCDDCLEEEQQKHYQELVNFHMDRVVYYPKHSCNEILGGKDE